MPYKCGVVNCRGNYNQENKCRVFRLPRDASERQTWLDVLPPRENFDVDAEKFRICERHWTNPPMITIPGGSTRPAIPPSVFFVPTSCLPTPKPSPRRTNVEYQQLRYLLKKKLDKISSLATFTPEKDLKKNYDSIIISRCDERFVCVFMTEGFFECRLSVIVENKSTLCSPLTFSAYKDGISVPLGKILNPNNGLSSYSQFHEAVRVAVNYDIPSELVIEKGTSVKRQLKTAVAPPAAGQSKVLVLASTSASTISQSTEGQVSSPTASCHVSTSAIAVSTNSGQEQLPVVLPVVSSVSSDNVVPVQIFRNSCQIEAGNGCNTPVEGQPMLLQAAPARTEPQLNQQSSAEEVTAPGALLQEGEAGCRATLIDIGDQKASWDSIKQELGAASDRDVAQMLINRYRAGSSMTAGCQHVQADTDSSQPAYDVYIVVDQAIGSADQLTPPIIDQINNSIQQLQSAIVNQTSDGVELSQPLAVDQTDGCIQQVQSLPCETDQLALPVNPDRARVKEECVVKTEEQTDSVSVKIQNTVGQHWQVIKSEPRDDGFEHRSQSPTCQTEHFVLNPDQNVKVEKECAMKTEEQDSSAYSARSETREPAAQVDQIRRATKSDSTKSDSFEHSRPESPLPTRKRFPVVSFRVREHNYARTFRKK